WLASLDACLQYANNAVKDHEQNCPTRPSMGEPPHEWNRCRSHGAAGEQREGILSTWANQRAVECFDGKQKGYSPSEHGGYRRRKLFQIDGTEGEKSHGMNDEGVDCGRGFLSRVVRVIQEIT